MDTKLNGILMIFLAILLAVVYIAVPNFLIYTFWFAVVAILIYGIYLFTRK